MLKHSRLKNHATSMCVTSSRKKKLLPYSHIIIYQNSAIASGCIYTIGNIITLGATNVSIGKKKLKKVMRGRSFKYTLFLIL